MKTRDNRAQDLQITPMIDVVFQLIIFFIVTMNLHEAHDTSIRLPGAPHGSVVKRNAPTTVDVNRRGWLSIGGAQLTTEQLRSLLDARRRQQRRFPVLIRADARVNHAHVKAVVDICADMGLHEVSFVGLKSGG